MKSNIFKKNQDIEATKESGPIYADLAIWSRGNGFIVAPPKLLDITIDNYAKDLMQDGHLQTCTHIARYGWIMEDFMDVPLNKLGLKTLATSGKKELVLAANGLMTIYSGGIPAQKGFPSLNQFVSSAWVNGQGELMVPSVSIFTPEEYTLLAVLNSTLHFRPCKHLPLFTSLPVDRERSNSTYFSAIANEEGLNPCNYLAPSLGGSMFSEHYPKFKGSHMRYIDRNKVTFSDFIPFI